MPTLRLKSDIKWASVKLFKIRIRIHRNKERFERKRIELVEHVQRTLLIIKEWDTYWDERAIGKVFKWDFIKFKRRFAFLE
jgi:hypothetical protein